MNKEVPVSLVLGCGENGLRWANNRQIKEESLVIGLDHDKLSNLMPNYVIGDALNLPFKERSVNCIYADFILNAIQVKNNSIKEIIKNPRILKSETFPETVNDWYTYSLNESGEKVMKNLENIRWLLRAASILEMMRVLKNNGEILIIDRPHIINWTKIQTDNILRTNPRNIEIKELEINSDDYARSSSLREIAKDGEPLGKISLKKLY